MRGRKGGGGVARRIVREDVDVWRKAPLLTTATAARGRCGHVTRRLCVFYLVDGMQGATAPANSCKEFALLGSLVHARALSTPSSTPANYHLSRATSLRNQFLPQRGEGKRGEERREAARRGSTTGISKLFKLPSSSSLFPERITSPNPPSTRFPRRCSRPPLGESRLLTSGHGL